MAKLAEDTASWPICYAVAYAPFNLKTGPPVQMGMDWGVESDGVNST